MPCAARSGEQTRPGSESRHRGILPSTVTVMDSTVACLTTWMPRQRWYGAKARDPQLRVVAAWDLPDPFAARGTPRAVVTTLLVADDGADPVVLYQVPVVARPTASVDPDSPHIIGSPDPGTTLIDGAFDPAYTEALLRLVTRGGTGEGERATAHGHPTSAVSDEAPYVGGVLSGEQSNTSIVFRAGEAWMPIIVKVFRQLHAGVNPDIELQTGLATARSPFVPGAIGSVSGEWPHPATGFKVEGSLAFAQEFLPGVEDARRVALAAAEAGEDFTIPARDLGIATAAVHTALAEEFGTVPASEAERELVAASWQRRLDIATIEVPAIADVRAEIEAAYDRALAEEWPDLQRVHGDYHLGQVILVPGRGWVLLDFEGEPMRPMVERRLPDLAARDVAGLLRSFDYIAGSLELEGSSAPGVRAWADAARAAFLAGYASASAVDLDAHRALLAAFELDKAVYEAIYEARNRPAWISIPLDAVRRLAGR